MRGVTLTHAAYMQIHRHHIFIHEGCLVYTGVYHVSSLLGVAMQLQERLLHGTTVPTSRRVPRIVCWCGGVEHALTANSI